MSIHWLRGPDDVTVRTYQGSNDALADRVNGQVLEDDEERSTLAVFVQHLCVRHTPPSAVHRPSSLCPPIPSPLPSSRLCICDCIALLPSLPVCPLVYVCIAILPLSVCPSVSAHPLPLCLSIRLYPHGSPFLSVSPSISAHTLPLCLSDWA